MKRKRMVLNMMGMLMILVGGLGLTAPGAASTVLSFDKCEAANGAKCEGKTCCANKTKCSTNPKDCEEMKEQAQAAGGSGRCLSGENRLPLLDASSAALGRGVQGCPPA